MPSPSLFIYAHLDAAGRKLLESSLADEQVVFVDKHRPVEEQHAYLSEFQASDICFGNVPADWLPQAPRLRWMQLESIGFEYYQHVRGLPPTLEITNLKGLFDVPAAETAVAGLLSLYRGVNELIPAQAAQRWVSLEVRPKMQLLHGKQVVILGHGSIGRKLRQLLEAFGCRVQSFARTTPGAELRSTVELDAALPLADVVACCLPKTPETRGFIDQRRIQLLKATAVFVNIGRGSVVEEPALVLALQHARIGGAVLDVTWDEPIPAGHPLWTCPRTLLMQHTGGGYHGELLAKVQTFLANFARYKKGEPLQNVVNLARGY